MYAVDEKLCVSCGCCIKVCPKEAIEVKNGMYAIIDEIYVLDVVNVFLNVNNPLKVNSVQTEIMVRILS